MDGIDISGMEIAVIGINGRFPGANTVDAFWHNLRNGIESISFFTDQELIDAGIKPDVHNMSNYVRAGGVLEGAELFDASFFGYTPREAEIIDPQQRIFLECAWEAIETAGYDTEIYKGRIGIFAGLDMNSYLLYNLYSNKELIFAVGGYQMMISSDKDYLSTRTSYKLNLRGPSLTVQTACSSSLVAVHLACQSLLNGECDIALAGGVRISVPQKAGYLYQDGGIASPDGRCRAFDAQARGTVGGNGVGIVVLRRLADAIADGDYLHAVIRGSAINNDGALKVGYTAPSVDGQAEVITDTLTLAGVDATTISYIEAHGTGTPLGDPIEIAALSQAFRAYTQEKNYCAVGSLKTNIGHLGAASGVAGLIKTILSLKHRMIPPSLHFEQYNPKIDFANSPFYISDKLSPWETDRIPRRAGVSSFGIGGTNAHIVLEEAPIVSPSSTGRPWHLLVLSAKTSSALQATTMRLIDHLKINPDLSIADVAYTLQVGRRAFEHRRMLVCKDIADAVASLETQTPMTITTSVQAHKDRPIMFMFSGQGSQYINMALDIYREEPVFQECVNHCAELLRPVLGLDLRMLLYPGEIQSEMAVQQLNQTFITQPALFTIEYALAKLWMSWGIRPQAMIGHSIGEYVAACLAGVFSLEDALELVSIRGRLMQNLPRGAMLAVKLSEQALQPFLDDTVQLAAVNTPSLCVVSGCSDAIEQLERRFVEEGWACRPLHTSHAFHSAMMDPILETFGEHVKNIPLRSPQIPYVSNVTGTWVEPADVMTPQYWVNHLRQTVRFAEGIGMVLRRADHILLEVGPGQMLKSLVDQHPDKSPEQIVLSSLRRLQNQLSDEEFVLQTLGQLWLAGAHVDWLKLYTNERRCRLPLPTYPFERDRYWVEQQHGEDNIRQVSLRKASHITNWFYTSCWKQSLPPSGQRLEKAADQDSCLLVFIDSIGLGARLVEQLAQQGNHVISVIAGSQFSRINDYAYMVNPRQRDDYEKLFKACRSLRFIPQKIIHLWNIISREDSVALSDFIEESQFLGFYSLIFVTQIFEQQIKAEQLEIIVISSDIQEVTGEEEICVEKSTILGTCKVIPQEYPNIICRSIDIITSDIQHQQKRLVSQLIAEIATKSSDSIIAYRGTRRWIQTFEAVQPDESTMAKTRLRHSGVYLITGGMGNIGLVFAEYLARTAQARLVLVGRSAFPRREEWEQWLACHDNQEIVSKKIRRLQAIEALGSEILTISADVADVKQMQAVITQIDTVFGTLNGVIHAAGIAGEDAFYSVQEISREECERIFRPKIRGLFVLESILKDRELDFCLLQSSLSSILGGLGYVAYASANIFMDAFTYSHNRKGQTFWTSLNWDGWRFETDTVQNSYLNSPRLELSITPQEGDSVIQNILSMELTSIVSQVIISTSDLLSRVNQWIKLEPLQKPGHGKETITSSLYSRPHQKNDYVAPRNDFERTIVTICQELIGIEQMGIYDNFFELGGHSLLATQLVSRLRKHFSVDLSLRSLFETPTIAHVANVIEELIVKKIEELSEDDARLLVSGEG
jgi:acyl transferase domain-containing protein/acyl carrier protein